MKIEVTQRDISLAVKRRRTDKYSDDPENHCPIALAIKRTTHKAVTVLDCSAFIRVDGDTLDEREYWLPAKARKFIRKFDTKKRVRPFTFEATPDWTYQ